VYRAERNDPKRDAVVQGLLALYASARYSWQEAEFIRRTQKFIRRTRVRVIGSRFAGRAAGIQATLQLIIIDLQKQLATISNN
jgi:hypothetical protein